MFYAVNDKLLLDPYETMDKFCDEEMLPIGFYTDAEWTRYIMQKSKAIFAKSNVVKENYNFIVKEYNEYV